MSLLNSVLGSIGTGNRRPLPQAPDRAFTGTPPPITTTLTQNKPPGTIQQQSSSVSSRYQPSKRKVEDNATQRSVPAKVPRSNNAPPNVKATTSSTGSLPAKAEPQGQTLSATAAPAKAPSEGPPKGSYAEIMARARAVQEEKAAAAQSVGLIKHASSKKERLSKSERRRREEELRAQIKGKVSRVGQNGAIQKYGQPSKGGPKDIGNPTSRGTAKIKVEEQLSTKDKATRLKEKDEITYKGTAGLKKPGSSHASRHGGKHRAAREDRYLDTDEEDSEGSFIVDDDEDEEQGASRNAHAKGITGRQYRYVDEDDESDASADMEAGWDDVEMEERRAAIQAKKDDEREKALEEKLRREKEARRRAYIGKET